MEILQRKNKDPEKKKDLGIERQVSYIPRKFKMTAIITVAVASLFIVAACSKPKVKDFLRSLCFTFSIHLSFFPLQLERILSV